MLANKKGKTTKLKYSYVAPHFEDGYACVTDKKGKYGLIDKKGAEIIKLKYELVSEFSDGLASVCRNNKWGFVNMEGKEVIKPQYDQDGRFPEGLAAVCKGGKWMFIDKKGNVILE